MKLCFLFLIELAGIAALIYLIKERMSDKHNYPEV